MLGVALRPAFGTARRARPLQEGGVARAGAVAVAQPPANAFQHRHRLRRQHRLVHRPVDLGRRPAWKRPALGRRAVAAVGVQHVDGQPRLAVRGPARRAHVGHLDPDLGQLPRLVHCELAAPHVGRVVHLDRHVRQYVLAHDDGGAVGPAPFRMKIDGLVRLHDPPPRAVLVPQQQVGRADDGDVRAPRHRDQGRHLGQALRGLLVVEAGRLADHGGLGGGVPDLDAAVVVVELLAGDVHGAAAGEFVGVQRRHDVVHRRRSGRGAGRRRGRFRPARRRRRGDGQDCRVGHVS